ncbi:MAG: (R)-hydratase [Magnetospirillum sp.]|nr:(R)-hydratase [Magnetospirillum sp.]
MKVVALDDIVEGTTARLPFRVSAEDMDAFARLSGDFNPLHTDDAFARASGFAGRVVYGGLLVAQVSRLLGMELPGRDGVWIGLKMDFRAPLFIDEAADLEAIVDRVSEAVALVRLKLSIRAGERLIATGSAESTLHA